MVSPLQGCCDRCGLPPLEAWVQPMLASPCVQDLRNEPSIPSSSSAFKPCCCPLWVSPLSKVVSLRSYCSQPHSPVRRISSAPKRRTYTFQPSVHTNSARRGWQQACTCESNRAARPRSCVRLTTPLNHKRVETIEASPIQAIMLHPFTRTSSACICTRSRCPCCTTAWWTRLPVLPRSVPPAGHRAFVQAKCLHNRLDRAAIGH